MEFFEETSVFWPLFFMHQLTRKLQNLKNSDKLHQGNEHHTFIPSHPQKLSLPPFSPVLHARALLWNGKEGLSGS